MCPHDSGRNFCSNFLKFGEVVPSCNLLDEFVGENNQTTLTTFLGGLKPQNFGFWGFNG